MDPQTRMLLEVTYEAIVDAGKHWRTDAQRTLVITTVFATKDFAVKSIEFVVIKKLDMDLSKA